jgi:hypothetical protein
MLPASSRSARGYVLLAVMLLLAALVLLVAVAQQRSGDEAVTGAFERSDAQARALAEVGLERTRAYLGALMEQDVDLDRALDPGLDTDCAQLPVLGGDTLDDFLPTFTDGKRVVASSSGKAFLRVPVEDTAEGAYFVRIDDNDDDAQDSSVLGPATANNPAGNCLEGPLASPARTNPVRDRDGTVWITVIGVHPGTSLEGAAARHTLRVLVGPGASAGLIAGGTVRMQGRAYVCGEFGDVVATGSIEDGCLCGSGCFVGVPWKSCGPGNACTGQSGGSTCSAKSGGAGGECTAEAPVEAPPKVSPWDVTLAPTGCQAGQCTPFYYLRLDEQVPAQARLYAWNYAACPSPRAGPRICAPRECGSCWGLLNVTHEKLDVLVPDAPWLWRADGVTGFRSGPAECDAADTGSYPGTPGFTRKDLRNVTFDLLPANRRPRELAPLPRGVWFVEGNVRFGFGDEVFDCTQLGEDPLDGVSIIATGDIVHEAKALYLRPASPRGVVLLAGRDLVLHGGNSRVHTCGSSAAVMVHEQVELGANSHLEAQLVAENASTCSDRVSGPAVHMRGAATVAVPQVPPLSVGPPVRVRLYSESTH